MPDKLTDNLANNSPILTNSLTDTEIKKALECCIKSSHFGDCFENQCPLVSEEGCKVGKETLYPYVLDLINRKETLIEKLEKVEHYADKTIATQKAEIERLKYCNEANISTIATLHERLKFAKAEAYKEFAEKLKEYTTQGFWETDAYVGAEQIDNLLKELVGDNNAGEN